MPVPFILHNVSTLSMLSPILSTTPSTQQVNNHRDPTSQKPDLCKATSSERSPEHTLLPNVADPPRWLINRRVGQECRSLACTARRSNPSPNFLTCRLMLHTLRRLCPRGFQFHLTVGSTVQTSLGDNTVRQRTHRAIRIRSEA